MAMTIIVRKKAQAAVTTQIAITKLGIGSVSVGVQVSFPIGFE